MSTDTSIVRDTVYFTNLSTGFPPNTIYAWNYMDQCADDTSTIVCIDSIVGKINPYHSFKFFGYYNINLSAKDVNNTLLSTNDTLHVMATYYNQPFVNNCNWVVNGDFEDTWFCPIMEYNVNTFYNTFSHPLAGGAPIAWNVAWISTEQTPDYYFTGNCLANSNPTCSSTPDWVPCNPSGEQLAIMAEMLMPVFGLYGIKIQ